MDDSRATISFDFSQEPFLLTMKDAAVAANDRALWHHVVHLEDMLTGYFREPPVVAIADLMAALHGTADVYCRVTGEAPDEALPAEFFIRWRTIAIETQRLPTLGSTLQ